MKRTLLTIALFSLGLSSKGQNLTFVDANNLVVNSSNSATWWKPNEGEIWKIEGINGYFWSNATTTYRYVYINSSLYFTNNLNFPVWIGSNDSIKVTPYTQLSNSEAVINYLIFKNEP